MVGGEERTHCTALCGMYIGVITVLGTDLCFLSMYDGSMQGCTLGMLAVITVLGEHVQWLYAGLYIGNVGVITVLGAELCFLRMYNPTVFLSC